MSQAQIISDNTLSTKVDPLDDINFTITGGRQLGGNLFHSFSQFSVSTGGSAVFDNPYNVQNIFSRVTGHNSISNIDGLIKANGNANLFLLNPNGIMFGPNAHLDIGGSLVATTANQINFADGTFFSATDLQLSPMLTVSIPIGLKFRETAEGIVNQSIAEDISDIPGNNFGLQVQLGKTLALIGGDIHLDGGGLFAPGGRIELGSVASENFVGLTQNTEGLIFTYENVQNFQDIKLSQDALTSTTGISSGNILLHGRKISITGDSGLISFNFGVDPGGAVIIKASDSLEVSGLSSVNTNTFSAGASGDIVIGTKKLVVRDFSFIDTASVVGGQGGSLTINASESVEVDGSGGLSRLTTQTLGNQNAGDLKVTTQKLILRDGGQIDSSARLFGGNGGTIIVNAFESVEVSGQGIVPSGEVVSSGLFARTQGSRAFGNGGSLSINTSQLLIQDGGSISVAAIEGSLGQAGSLNIDASESVIVNGTNSSVLSNSGSSLAAGDLTIHTPRLELREGALISASTVLSNGGDVRLQDLNSLQVDNSEISASSTETGVAGSVRINENQTPVNLVQLTNGSLLAAQAEQSGGEAGSVIVNARNLTVDQGASISASNMSGINGGDIILQNVETLQVKDGGAISATTKDGQAGSLQLNQYIAPAKSVFLDGGDLTVAADGLGNSGDITLSVKNLNLQNGAGILASTDSGRGGDITIEGLNNLQVDHSLIAASTKIGQAGNLTISDAESIHLSGTGGLSVEATNGGTAGNLTVTTDHFSISDGAAVTVSSPDSDGQAGNITVDAHALSLDHGSITAETGSSEQEGANITLRIDNLLTLENESLISATANGDADGGNIDIDTAFLVVFPPTGPNGSDIIAQAERGRGGLIDIDAQGIFGIQEGIATLGNRRNDLDASSAVGADGQVTITTDLDDPNRGLIELPETVVDPNTLIAQNPCKKGTESELTATGRGGLPPKLTDDLTSPATQVGLIDPAPTVATDRQQKETITTSQEPKSISQNPVIPAQGWIFNDQGEVLLTAYNSSVTDAQRLKLSPEACPVP